MKASLKKPTEYHHLATDAIMVCEHLSHRLLLSNNSTPPPATMCTFSPRARVPVRLSDRRFERATMLSGRIRYKPELI